MYRRVHCLLQYNNKSRICTFHYIHHAPLFPSQRVLPSRQSPPPWQCQHAPERENEDAAAARPRVVVNPLPRTSPPHPLRAYQNTSSRFAIEISKDLHLLKESPDYNTHSHYLYTVNYALPSLPPHPTPVSHSCPFPLTVPRTHVSLPLSIRDSNGGRGAFW